MPLWLVNGRIRPSVRGGGDKLGGVPYVTFEGAVGPSGPTIRGGTSCGQPYYLATLTWEFVWGAGPRDGAAVRFGSGRKPSVSEPHSPCVGARASYLAIVGREGRWVLRVWFGRGLDDCRFAVEGERLGLVHLIEFGRLVSHRKQPRDQ